MQTVLDHLYAPGGVGWWRTGHPLTPGTGTGFFPDAVVDSRFTGWRHQTGGHYHTARGATRMSYTELDTTHGPLRHVMALPGPDRDELMYWVGRSGDKAVSHMLIATWVTLADRPGRHHELRAADDGWQGEGLIALAEEFGPVLGTAPLAYTGRAVSAFVGLIDRWTGGQTSYPRFYLDVAAAFNDVIAQAMVYGGGWVGVADLPLRRSAPEHLRHSGAHKVWGHFDPDHDSDYL